MTVTDKRISQKSKYLDDWGVDFGSFGNGVIDGIIGAIPELLGFLWDMATSSEARQAVIEGIKQLVSDPIGTLKGILGDKYDLYSAVLSGEGTEQQKYEAGNDVGGLVFSVLAVGGAAQAKRIFKLLKKNKADNVLNKKVNKLEKKNYENYGSESLDIDRMVEQPLTKVTKFRSFTKGNFRYNLEKLTGNIPVNSQAHHVFPQKFSAQFSKAGINIHDPKYGAWWQTTSHLKNAKAYNAAWQSFLKTNPSQSQILNKGRELMQQYGIPVNY